MFKAVDNLSSSMPSPGLLMNILSGGGAPPVPTPTAKPSPRAKDFRYLRVWDAVWDGEIACFDRVSEEPVGVVHADMGTEFWLKIDGQWRSRHEMTADKKGFVYEIVSQSEYETDLAFELFPTLKITYRPVRQWIKRNTNKIWTYNLMATCAGMGATFSFLDMAAGEKDFWFYVCISVLFMTRELLRRVGRK